MPTNYKNLSERDKQVSNLQHLDTLDANTDEVENLLSHIESRIDSGFDGIADQLTNIASLLNDIKNNTAQH